MYSEKVQFLADNLPGYKFIVDSMFVDYKTNKNTSIIHTTNPNDIASFIETLVKDIKEDNTIYSFIFDNIENLFQSIEEFKLFTKSIKKLIYPYSNRIFIIL